METVRIQTNKNNKFNYLIYIPTTIIIILYLNSDPYSAHISWH